MSQQAPSCKICLGRSTWDFLQDFYLRVEAAENHARRLEQDFCEAQTTMQHCQNTLVQCEASLYSSWEVLNEEHRNHQAYQDALVFESERQKETIALLERILKEAILSSEATEILGSRHTTAKATVYQTTPTFGNFLTAATPIGKTLTETGTSTSVERQSESAQRLMPSLVPGSHQPGEHESQIATRVCSTEISNQNQQNSSGSTRSGSYATSRAANVYDCTESEQITESRKVAQDSARGSPLRRTQFPGEYSTNRQI
ncbi:hypothetical protein BKA65DRAFT_488088 [Rhexocercosporidium sp. MPI-PUGE-AT-0058]|nr:hypothetical protein BKA65DRAFT_488088 [Rhexocercosporidium sp. MPI-PUGE-AT-0058]